MYVVCSNALRRAFWPNHCDWATLNYEPIPLHSAAKQIENWRQTAYEAIHSACCHKNTINSSSPYGQRGKKQKGKAIKHKISEVLSKLKCQLL